MVLGGGEEEPGCGEGLQEVEQLVSRHHGQTLQVGRNCGPKKNNKKLEKRVTNLHCSAATQPLGVTFNYGILTVHDHSEQTVKERLEALMPAADDLMEDLNRTGKLQRAL